MKHNKCRVQWGSCKSYKNLYQHWFWTGRLSIARRFQRLRLSGKQLSSVFLTWAHTECPAPLSSLATFLDPSTDIKMGNHRHMNSGVAITWGPQEPDRLGDDSHGQPWEAHRDFCLFTDIGTSPRGGGGGRGGQYHGFENKHCPEVNASGPCKPEECCPLLENQGQWSNLRLLSSYNLDFSRRESQPSVSMGSI